MMEPDSLVLEHLRSIRDEMAKLIAWTEVMSVEMTAMQHLFSAIGIQSRDHLNVAEIKVRLDRTEARLRRGKPMNITASQFTAEKKRLVRLEREGM